MARPIPTVEEARDYLARFNFFARYVHGPEEGDVYVATHARRFVETLRRVPPLPERPRVLELGAVPYSMSILVRRYLDADLSPLSFYEVAPPGSRHVLESPDGSEAYEFEYRALNVEKDLYPFADGTFSLVLCCEILEHLLINPAHMFHEAHRVLQPGGYLMLTTPNVVREANVRALLDGKNINDAYHGNGIYGRHNREFAPAEVPVLLEACGFEIVRHETVDVYDTTLPGSAPGREDTIVTVARATGRPRTGTPPGLYVLMNEYLNVVRPAIEMGKDDVGHLGLGWYDLEREGDTAFRWSGQIATFHLNTAGARSIGLYAQVHHPDLLQRPVRLSMSVDARPPLEQTVIDHRLQDIVFELPEPVTGTVAVRLSLDRDWVPAEGNESGDGRRLGLCVHRCWSR